MNDLQKQGFSGNTSSISSEGKKDQVPYPKCDTDDSSTRSRQEIKCEVCNVWYHTKCVKLTKRQVQAMNDLWIGSCCSSSPPTMQVAQSFSFSREGSIFKQVPKAFRLHSAKALIEIFNTIVTENSVPACSFFLILHLNLLQNLEKERKKQNL